METGDILLLTALMFAGATLYSSVGHAGASAYLAAMALVGVAPATMRPTALVLNIIVSSIATWRYVRAGWFSWPTLWPFLIAAMPMAFIGGGIHLPGEYYRPFVGIVLWIAAARLFLPGEIGTTDRSARAPLWGALIAGGVIGLLSGLTGTGGGIFLSPLLIFLRWSETRTVSGISAAFILANSASGLAGNIASVGSIPAEVPYFIVAVVAGALIGTTLGISTLARKMILTALALVLLVAGGKLLFS
ncbi:MAG: sulfite exporter TauE/SafE family protein [Rhodospirillales bacterium]|nr:sulfite exporter TauE/SafE family protein [Rhodospirillales bacterium]